MRARAEFHSLSSAFMLATEVHLVQTKEHSLVLAMVQALCFITMASQGRVENNLRIKAWPYMLKHSRTILAWEILLYVFMGF